MQTGDGIVRRDLERRPTRRALARSLSPPEAQRARGEGESPDAPRMLAWVRGPAPLPTSKNPERVGWRPAQAAQSIPRRVLP